MPTLTQTATPYTTGPLASMENNLPMKKFIFEIILFLLCINAFGTAQIPDILIYNGDTLSLFDCPLEYYHDLELIRPKSLFGGNGCLYTACYRNYVATWKIENNKLYLVQIRNACYPTDSKYVAASLQENSDSIGKEFADLKSLFTGQYKDGKVFADWVNIKMISPVGKLLFYIHDGFESIFEKEIEFTLVNGIVTSTQEYDNSKTKISKYNSDPKLLADFLKNNIDYSNVPETAEKIRIVIRIMGSTENGKVDGVSILKGYNEPYNNEALRVVNSIPEWDVLYRHGKKFSIPWMVSVTFESKKK